MNVILSSNIHHYNYTARAIESEGALKKYITGAQFARAPFFLRFLPHTHQSMVHQRIDHNLASSRLSSMWMLEFMYKALLKIKGLNREKIIHYHNEVFDRLASLQLSSCQYFHFVSSVGYYSALKAKKQGAKIILDERAEHPLYLAKLLQEELALLDLERQNHTPALKEVTRKLLKEYEIADYMIVASEYAKKTFVDQGMNPDKVYVVPYGCDSGTFYPQKKKDDTFRIISVGQITPRKGTAYLINAFLKLPIQGTELVLIGRVDPIMESFMQNLPPNIKYYPYVPNNKLNDYYTNSSVFVLPSLSDSFGLVVLEAMSAGLPVIVTDHVGAADAVETGADGYIIPVRDSEAIYDKLHLLYKNPRLQQEMSSQAITKAKQYSWDNYMNKLIHSYRDIAANN